MAKSNAKVTKDTILSGLEKATKDTIVSYLEKKAPDELLEIMIEVFRKKSSTATPEFAFRMGILSALLYRIIEILRSDTKLSEVRLRIEKE